MVPMVAFHGDQDTTVPIDTGEMGFSGSRVISNLLDFNDVCFDLTVAAMVFIPMCQELSSE